MIVSMIPWDSFPVRSAAVSLRVNVPGGIFAMVELITVPRSTVGPANDFPSSSLS